MKAPANDKTASSEKDSADQAWCAEWVESISMCLQVEAAFLAAEQSAPPNVERLAMVSTRKIAQDKSVAEHG